MKTKCENCNKPATCIGRYESMVEFSPACDDCCGHGCEDGVCYQLDSDEGREELKNAVERQKEFAETFSKFHAKVFAEAFPGPPHDQDGNVGVLLRKMFLNKITRESFEAGWNAARKFSR